jgi:hypothetical protein
MAFSRTIAIRMKSKVVGYLLALEIAIRTRQLKAVNFGSRALGPLIATPRCSASATQPLYDFPFFYHHHHGHSTLGPSSSIDNFTAIIHRNCVAATLRPCPFSQFWLFDFVNLMILI